MLQIIYDIIVKQINVCWVNDFILSYYNTSGWITKKGYKYSIVFFRFSAVYLLEVQISVNRCFRWDFHLSWFGMHTDDFHYLYSSPNTIRAIKSISTGQGIRHVRRKGELHTPFCWGNLTERGNLEAPGVDGRKILRHIFRSVMWGYVLDRAESG